MNDESMNSVPTLSKSAQKRLNAQAHNAKVRENLKEDVRLTGEQREKLEELSKFVFGSTSRYATLMTVGEVVPETYTTTEYVPGADGQEGTTREVELPVNYRDSKAPILKQKVYSLEEVSELMLKLKDQKDKMIAALEKQKADKLAAQKQKELEQKVQNEIGGSSI